MPLFLLTALVQILFAVHAYRTGKNTYWIYIILIFPLMGCVIYFFAEVMPEIMHGRAGQQARTRVKRALDPEKDYREAKYAFDTAPTVANRIALAQILTARRDHGSRSPSRHCKACG